MRDFWGAFLLTVVVLAISAFWLPYHRAWEAAGCPDPVYANGLKVSCHGMAGVHLTTPTPAR